MDSSIDRRNFLRTTAAATAMTALSYSRVMGANERIRLGVIGPGQRGSNRMRTAKELGAEIVALADANKGLMELARAESLDGAAVDMYRDYHELLAREDIDGVINATPDHLHHSVILASVAAGKDMYTEKPLTRTLEEGYEVVHAVEASDRIVQVGNQRRSGEHFRKAREIIESGGIGTLRFVRIWDFRYRPIDPYVMRAKNNKLFGAEQVDWEKFRGPAPDRPYDPVRASGWRWFWDYAGGLMTDIGPHWLDVAMWLSGRDYPVSAVCNGGNYQSPEWETPDNVHAVLDCGEFAIVFMVQFMNGQEYDGAAFYGLEGSIIQDNARGEMVRYDKNRKEIEAWPVGDEGTIHMQNFLDSMRSREQPTSPVSLANRVLIGAHMANASFRSGQRQVWDGEKQTYGAG